MNNQDTDTGSVPSKRCSKCQVMKPLTKYHISDSRMNPPKLRSDCEQCFKARIKAKELACKEYQYQVLSNNPCEVCGESDPTVLEFDHIGFKRSNVSQAVDRQTLDYVKDEISRCQILCSNCHKRKTANNFGWFKFKKYMAVLKQESRKKWKDYMFPLWIQEINDIAKLERLEAKMV